VDAEQQSEVIGEARSVLRAEAEAVSNLVERLGDPFLKAVDLIFSSQGRVIVTGMGKSGAIARKTASTLASTGTPAFHLHPGEGVHGDLGMVTAGDVVIALSYSGETDEVSALLPVLKRMNVSLIAVTGNKASTLAQYADTVLDVSVEREACPHNLAPTTSTTAMLALMDALSLCIMRLRRFTREDYAFLHPAGSLGRRLLLRVSDLMRTGDRVAVCGPDATVRDGLFAITKAQSGCAFGVDPQGQFVGLLSDGDIRRLWLRNERALQLLLADVLNSSPRTVNPDLLVTEALAVMEQEPPIAELPVLDAERRPIGVLNLKDITRAGIL
jgi:arabinose-5-phosphate isomerase